MQHLIIEFQHSIRDVILYCEFIQKLKPLLQEGFIGSYLGDDMAIDGGDAKAMFECSDARILFKFISPLLKELSFMQNAKVTLVFGEVDSSTETCTISLS